MFAFYQHLPHIDVCRYVVSRGGLQYRNSFLGIDSEVDCVTESNVNFLHFVWKHCEAMYTFRKHAITVLSVRDVFSRGCCVCDSMMYQVPVVLHMGLSHLHGFTSRPGPPSQRLPKAGRGLRFSICTLQPPSLRDRAFKSYYTLVFNIERFELTRHVTVDSSVLLRFWSVRYWASAPSRIPFHYRAQHNFRLSLQALPCYLFPR